jgi:hypothetical protein
MPNKLVSEAVDPRLGLGGNKPPKVHELFASELVETYGLDLAKVEAIAARANDAPEKIATDQDLSAWTEIGLDANSLLKVLDTARLNEQRPITQVIKSVFGGPIDRCVKIVEAAKERATVYSRAKIAAELRERAEEQARLRAAADQHAKDAQVAAEFGDTDQAVEHVRASDQLSSQAQAAPAPKAADIARVRSDSGLATAVMVWKFQIEDYTKVDLNALRMFFAPADIDKAVRAVVKKQKGATKVDGVRVYEEAEALFRRS